MVGLSLCVLLLAPVPPRADAATVRLAKTLAAEFQKGGAFEDATLERPASLAALGHLALTSKALPLIQISYETIAQRLSAFALDGNDPRTAPPLAIEAVLVGMARDQRPILDAAIRAAAVLNQAPAPHEPSLRMLADLAVKHREPDVRYAALSRLWEVSLRVFSQSDLVPETIVQALDDTNEGVVGLDIAMLNLLGQRLQPFAEPARRARLARALKRLRGRESPALRAAAIGASAKMFDPGIELPGLPKVEPSEDAKDFASELLQTLNDPEPVVRGMAAVALGFIRFAEGAEPRLATLLDDAGNVSATLGGGLRTLTAEEEPIELPVRVVDLGEPETVGMAALRALMIRSLFQEAKPEWRLDCDHPEKTFAECAKRAKAWVARVSGGASSREPKRLKYVRPVYPDIARKARVEGDVILELEISPQGSVVNVKIMRNIPLLGDAAADAARHWVYEPTLRNGVAVTRTLTVTERFALPAARRTKP